MSTSAARRLIAALLLCALGTRGQTHAVQAPEESLRFGVIGDFGTGTPKQYETARAMAAVNVGSRYDMVLMVGDNIYSSWNRRAVVDRFEMPYRSLLDAGVPFFASLGNHDAIDERQYPLFNMGGERYYSFSRLNVQFFALDSNYMDAAQLAWLRRGLEASTMPWKISVNGPAGGAPSRWRANAALASLTNASVSGARSRRWMDITRCAGTCRV